LGPNDPAVADVLEQLAVRIGYNAREAKQYFRAALEIRRRQFGDRDPRLVSTLARFAGQYTLGGRYREAGELMREAVAIRPATASDDPCEGGGAALFQELGR